MKTDMSPQAVTVRLRRTAQLRQLCLALGRALGETTQRDALRIGPDTVVETGTESDGTGEGK